MADFVAVSALTLLAQPLATADFVVGLNTSEIIDANKVVRIPPATLSARPSLKAVVSKSGAYTATTSDEVILCDAVGTAFTITLPAASGNSGLHFTIKKTDASANAVTIDGNAAETIDGAATQDLTSQYDALKIVCDGSNWHII